jgi:pyruvate dehydrogenase E2 component (dihydrolipoamide acetyltransferase)
MAEFSMPSLGADMDAGTLVEWVVKPGDTVARGQIVVVVETQKGAIDVEIFEPGVILELLVPVGQEVPVGTVLALLRGEGETDEQVRQAWARRRAGNVSTSEPVVAPEPTAAAPAAPTSTDSRRISPRARKLAAERGLDPAALEQLQGTGPGGAITGEDIERAARAQAPKAASKPAPSGMREAIGAAMSRSKREIPHYYLAHTLDVEPALAWLEQRNVDLPIAERLLPACLWVRAVALALRKHPIFSGHWRDGSFVPGDGIHVGLAVSLRGGGLVNPALAHADRDPLALLNARILELGTRARSGSLKASEFDTATITVTSLGERGVDTVFPVIVPPQVAIVGVGTVRKRPWVVDEALLVRRTVDISLAADHRASDGHAGARFLAHIEQLLQQPESL